jgi:hypothetical protein
VAIKHGTNPRGVYEQHWGEMDELLKLPGKARRASPSAPIGIDAAKGNAGVDAVILVPTVK